MQKYPKVAVVVLNYNGATVLKRCLNSLFKVSYPNLEIIVVDNNSGDGSLEEARKSFPRAFQIRNEENIGFAAGNNVGIRFALDRLADYVLLLNNDTEVAANFLSELIEVAETSEKNGILSPLIFQGDRKSVWFSGGKLSWFRMKSCHRQENIKKDFYTSDFITGCAMLVKKEVFGRIGMLDEDYFLYWEDADFSYRAKKAGFDLVVAAKSHIFHWEKSAEAKSSKLYWLVISGLIFFKKNTPFYLVPWIFIFLGLRRLKNGCDLRKNSFDEDAKIVKKAYTDFKTYAG